MLVFPNLLRDTTFLHSLSCWLVFSRVYAGNYKNTLEDVGITSTPEGSIIVMYSTPAQSRYKS